MSRYIVMNKILLGISQLFQFAPKIIRNFNLINDFAISKIQTSLI